MTLCLLVCQMCEKGTFSQIQSHIVVNVVLRFSKFLQCKAPCAIQACTCAIGQQWIFSDDFCLTGLQACLRIQIGSLRTLQV